VEKPVVKEAVGAIENYIQMKQDYVTFLFTPIFLQMTSCRERRSGTSGSKDRAVYP
jgi:hypothetical protein